MRLPGSCSVRSSADFPLSLAVDAVALALVAVVAA
jgi:hypothetical protein